MKINLLVSILLGSFILFSCNKEAESTEIEEGTECLVQIDGEFVDISLDEMPEFIEGGSTGFVTSIYTELNYPAEARENSIEGTCILNFEITMLGTVENIVIESDPGGEIGEASFNAFSIATQGIAFIPILLLDDSKDIAFSQNEIGIKKGGIAVVLSIFFNTIS